MPTLQPAPRRTAPLLLLGLLSPALSAQTDWWEYTGAAYWIDSWTTEPTQRTALMDLDGDGYSDLVALHGDGTLAVNTDTHSTLFVETLPAITDFAVSREGGEQLWAISHDQLVGLDWSHFTSGGSFTSTGVSASDFHSLRIQERGNQSKLLMIDQQGDRLRVYGLVGGSWVEENEVLATPAQGRFYDAVIVDWDGTGQEWLALQTDNALEVRTPAGALGPWLPAIPDGSHLEVLQGSELQWGHDLLAAHYVVTPDTPPALLFLNQFHNEMHFTVGFDPEQTVFADFLPAPGRETFIVSSLTREMHILKQRTTTTEAQQLFIFDYMPTGNPADWDPFHIDLEIDEPEQAPTHAPSVAVGDLDGDGDEDLILLDDMGRKMFVPGTSYDDEQRRYITPLIEPPLADPKFDFDWNFTGHLSADALDVEVWYVDLEAPQADPVSIMPTTRYSAGLVSFSVSTVNIAEPMYLLRVRPVDTTGAEFYPASIDAWGPDLNSTFNLMSQTGQIYAWDPNGTFSPFSGVGGGTARRPNVGPPGSGGSSTGGGSSSSGN